MTVPIIDATAEIVKLEFEVDNWIANSDVYIDDIEINGVIYDLEPMVTDIEYYNTGDTVGVTVYNGKLSGTIGIFVKSDTVGDGGEITIALTETDTGVFIGSYTVTVDDLSAGFTVIALAPPPPEEEEAEIVPEVSTSVSVLAINWWLIGGIIVAVLGASSIIFFLFRRRAAKKLTGFKQW